MVGVRTLDSVHHDVFISYSTTATALLGAAVEHALTTFGRELDAPFALSVFRDVSDQPATPDLAEALLRHLDASDWLLVLASPEASASPWVRQEIEHWVRTRGYDHVLIGVAAGKLAWDRVQARFDHVTTDCLPLDLLKFPAEPKWVDLRAAASPGFQADDEWFFDSIADFSATIRKIPKEQLVSRHWHEHRKALARRTAQYAELAVDSQRELALLLGAAANEMDDVPETRYRLSQLLEYSSGGYSVPAVHGAVTVIAVGVSGFNLVLGYDDGVIEVRDPRSPEASTALGSPRPGIGPNVLNVNDSGVAVAGYADGIVAIVSNAGTVTKRVADLRNDNSRHQSSMHVAIDENSTRVAFTDDRQVFVWDIRTDQVTEIGGTSGPFLDMRWCGDSLWVFQFHNLVTVDAATGKTTTLGQIPWLMRQGPRAIDASGELVVMAQLDGGWVSVSPVPETVESRPVAMLQGPPGIAQAVGIDPTGQHVALVVGDRVHLWALSAPDSPTVLEGLPRGITHVVLGSGATWIAVSNGDRCEVRDLTARSTICRTVPVDPVEVPSVIQGAVGVGFSPDGDRLAWLSNPLNVGRPDEDSLTVWDVPNWMPARGLPALSFERQDRGGQSAIVVRLAEAENPFESWTMSAGMVFGEHTVPEQARYAVDDAGVWRIMAGEKEIYRISSWPDPVLVRVSPSGRLVAFSSRSGRLTLRDLDAETDLWTAPHPQVADLAFTSQEDILATIADGGRVLLIDVATGQVTARFDVAPSAVQRLTFAPSGTLLAVAGVGGALTIVDTDPQSWRARARQRTGRALSLEEKAGFGLESVYLGASSSGRGGRLGRARHDSRG